MKVYIDGVQHVPIQGEWAEVVSSDVFKDCTGCTDCAEGCFPATPASDYSAILNTPDAYDCDGAPLYIGDSVYVRLSAMNNAYFGINRATRYGTLSKVTTESTLKVSLPDVPGASGPVGLTFNTSEIRKNNKTTAELAYDFGEVPVEFEEYEEGDDLDYDPDYDDDYYAVEDTDADYECCEEGVMPDCDGNDLRVGERAYVRASRMSAYGFTHGTRHGIVERVAKSGKFYLCMTVNSEERIVDRQDIRRNPNQNPTVDCDNTPIDIGDRVYVRLSALGNNSYYDLDENNRFGTLVGTLGSGEILRVHLPLVSNTEGYIFFKSSEIRRNNKS